MRKIFNQLSLTRASICLLAGLAFAGALHAEPTVLNVSYDVTREFYKD